MKFSIDLSIDKRSNSQHNTYILSWTPALYSYVMSRMNSDMNAWVNGWWDNDDFDWGVKECQNVRIGDRFFMLRVGECNTGIFAAGRFSSNPEKVIDCLDKDREVVNIEMEFEVVFNPEFTEIISIEELEQELPNLNWSNGQSGTCIDLECADKLELMWRDHIGRNKSLHLPYAVKNEGYDSCSDIDKAIEFALTAHASDYDLDGNPTILHPLAVGLMGNNDTERIVGFLHDVVEDTQYSFQDIMNIGFSIEIVEALRLLTHDKYTPYMEYIEQICKSGNQTAINVKLHDLKHNLARGKAGGHIRCVEKHTVALAYIENYLTIHPNIEK